MSRTTVKKAIAQFDAEELRQLVLDLYTRSKDAKELLDFYAEPDVEAKAEQYKKIIYKEVNRFTRHAHRPRAARIKAALKQYSRFEPGPEAESDLMVYAVCEIARMASDPFERIYDSTAGSLVKFVDEVLAALEANGLLEARLPVMLRHVHNMEPGSVCNRNRLREMLSASLADAGERLA